jgi:hypothetical protein
VSRRGAAAAAMLALAWGCSSRSESAPSPTLHTLRLPAETVQLPDRPGLDKFTSGCTPCHTGRYLLEQPTFPRKTWEAEVDKMRKTYGAPVSDEDTKPIVDYLVAVRGGGS